MEKSKKHLEHKHILTNFWGDAKLKYVDILFNVFQVFFQFASQPDGKILFLLTFLPFFHMKT